MRRALAAGVLFLLSGCAALSGLKAPEVSLADIRVSEIRLLEQRLRLSLRVLNPNDRDIVVDGLRFTLEVGGKRLAQGINGSTVTLPRFGETLLEVDGTAQLLNLLRDPSAVPSGGKFGYRLQGEVITRDYGRIPFERKGEAALPY